MSTRRKLIVGAALAISLCAALVFIVLFSALRTAAAARACYSDLLALNVGTSNEADALKVIAKHKGTPLEGCGSNRCTYLFVFENGALRKVGLSPYTRFGASVSLKSGVVSGKSVAIVSGGLAASSVGIQEFSSNMTGTFEVGGQNSDGPWRIDIQISPAASAADHNRVYALDLDCLKKLGGCPNARQIMPTINDVIAEAQQRSKMRESESKPNR